MYNAMTSAGGSIREGLFLQVRIREEIGGGGAWNTSVPFTRTAERRKTQLFCMCSVEAPHPRKRHRRSEGRSMTSMSASQLVTARDSASLVTIKCHNDFNER